MRVFESVGEVWFGFDLDLIGLYHTWVHYYYIIYNIFKDCYALFKYYEFGNN